MILSARRKMEEKLKREEAGKGAKEGVALS